MLQVASDVDRLKDSRPKTTLMAHSPEVRADDVLVGGSNSAFALPMKVCLERGSGSREGMSQRSARGSSKRNLPSAVEWIPTRR